MGTTLVPLDLAEVWALSDWLVRRIAFNPLLSKNVSDEKRERQTPASGGVRSSLVHSLPKLMHLPPNDIRNETPIALIK